jgi:hypothetical protein
MTRDNATSRPREATGSMVAVSTLTDTPAGPSTSSGTPAPAWSLAAALPGWGRQRRAVSLLLRPAGHHSPVS